MTGLNTGAPNDTKVWGAGVNTSAPDQVSSFCSTSDTHHVTVVKNPMKGHERG